MRDRRVWLSGLAAGLLIDVLDSAINGGVFGAASQAAYDRLRVTPPEGLLIVHWLAYGLVVGLAIAWITALSVRSGSSGGAGVKAAIVVWAIAHGPIFAEAIAGIMPGSLVLATGALELATWAAAGWLATWIQSRSTAAARLPAT